MAELELEPAPPKRRLEEWLWLELELERERQHATRPPRGCCRCRIGQPDELGSAELVSEFSEGDSEGLEGEGDCDVP